MLRHGRVLFIVVVLLVSLTGIGHAQEASPAYRLANPSTPDYLEALPEILARANTTYWMDYGPLSSPIESQVLSDELYWRLLDRGEMTFDELLTIYRAYVEARHPAESLMPALLELWLEANAINLAETPFFSFEGLHFEVRRLGETGAFALQQRSVTLGDAGFGGSQELTPTGDTYLAFDTGEPGRYEVPLLPVGAVGGILAYGDLNADSRGQPEFAYLHYSSPLNSWVTGGFQVVTWTGEHIEALTNIPFSYESSPSGPAFTWLFVNVDRDPAEELIQTQHIGHEDICNRLLVHFYDWQTDETLRVKESQTNFASGFRCALYQAETLMQANQYSEAIREYQTALAEPDRDPGLVPFTQIRLGLAWLALDRADEAQAVFEQINPAVSGSERNAFWVQAVYEAWQRDPRLLPMCQAAYISGFESLRYDSGSIFTEGSYFTDAGYYGPDSYAYEPEVGIHQVSCDLEHILKTQLAKIDIVNPLEQLESLGIGIEDSLAMDLDNDDQHEWLIWLKAPLIQPLLFVPTVEVDYAISIEPTSRSEYSYFGTPDMRLPDEDNQYWIITLPDGSRALLNVDFGIDPYIMQLYMRGGLEGDYSNEPSIGCAASGPPNYPGEVVMWRLEGESLRIFSDLSVCEYATPDTLFPAGEGSSELKATYEHYLDEWNIELRPATYVWDANRRTFVLTPQPTIPPLTLIPTTVPVFEEPPLRRTWYLGGQSLIEARKVFARRDFVEALLIVDEAFTDENKDETLTPAFQYYRALTLEALNRPDEALTIYIELYQSMSDTAWGMLANLHLEIDPS